MNGQALDREDPITVFWDIDTASVESSAASSVSTYNVVSSIRTAISIHGVIKTLRAYYDFSGTSPTRAANLRSELSSSGVMLIDCPGEGRKGAAAKRLLVDLIYHAWDNSSARTICIITGDRDFAYAIATLRMRKYNILLMAPAGAHSDLTSQVLVQMDWTKLILGINGAGGLTDRDDGSEKPATPQPQGPFADPSHPLPPTAPLDSRFKTSTAFGQAQGVPTPSVEMHDLPSRGRRDSAFSKSYGLDYNVFGNSGDVFMSPPPNIPSFGLGEGPLFSRPQSRLRVSHSDSAHPNDFYSGSTPRSMTPRPHFEDTVPPANSKGKERGFSLKEFSPTPKSSSFQPFGEVQAPVPTQASSPPKENVRRARAASVHTSSSTSSSGEGSLFSVVQRPEAPTAPTSEEHVDDDADEKQRQLARPLSRQVDPIPQSARTAETKLDVSPLISQPPTRRQADAVSVSSAVTTVTSTTAKVAPKVLSLKPPQQLPPPVQPAAASTSKFKPSPSLPIHNAPVGGSSSTLPAGPPAAWIHLVNTLRRVRGHATGGQLPGLLLAGDPQTYQKAGFYKFKPYIEAAANSGIVVVTGAADNLDKAKVSLIAPYL